MIPTSRAAVSVFTIPTDGPESDGTLEWTSTTVTVVETRASGVTGLGYTYGHKAIATLIADLLVPLVINRDAMDVPPNWMAMTRAIRHNGRSGLTAMAIAAVDTSLWAAALHIHPCCALGRVRHLECFHDHDRIERLLFDGTPEPVDGMLRPDVSRPGIGLDLKRADASRYAA